MLNRLARPALALLALAAIGACSKHSPSTSPSPASAPSAAAAPRPFTAAMVAEGDSIFHARGCKNCHGPDAKGAANGPNLTGPSWLHGDGSYNNLLTTITNGVPADQIKDPSHKAPMAGHGGRPTPLSDAQLKSVAAYVYTLGHH
ncbi:MAG TPA: c-type cytochrome [Gemmatimonadaceae bacterium]